VPWNFGEAVDPSFGIFASKTPGSDRSINVLDIGIQAAQLALAFGTTLAKCGHRSRLYDFKKIKLGDGAGLWAGGYAKLFDPRLHGSDICRCIGKIAIASRCLQWFWTRWRRHKQREREGAGEDDSDKGKKPAKKELEHGTSSNRYLSRSAGAPKRFKRIVMKPEGRLVGYPRSR
jgi:hypothetical protein